MSAAYLKAPLRESVKKCSKKARYPDENSARYIAMRRLIMQNPDTNVLYAYACPECGTWHLTRKQNGRPIYAAAEPAKEGE